jgi:hypothetical protein
VETPERRYAPVNVTQQHEIFLSVIGCNLILFNLSSSLPKSSRYTNGIFELDMVRQLLIDLRETILHFLTEGAFRKK